MSEETKQEISEASEVPSDPRDPPVAAAADGAPHDPPPPAPESPNATSSAPSTPCKPGAASNQTPSAASASPGDYNSQPSSSLASPPATNSPSVPQLGSPPHMHYPPPPPHYYAYGVMAYHPPPPPPPPPAAAGPASPNNSSNSITSPPRNAGVAAPYPPPPPHGYYPIPYPQGPPMHMAPQPYHPYAAQDWSKGRSNGGTTGDQQQQQPPPMPMPPPHMYGWAPMPMAHPMPPGQFVPVPPPGARYPGWGPPPQQPQRSFNPNRQSGGTANGARKKQLGKSAAGNKSRRLLEAREAASSPSQLASSIREEIENTGCTCKKTRCLKLYCQCFGAKIYCGPNCRCFHCSNTKDYEKQRQEAMRNILSRNPLAFDTKFTDPRTHDNSSITDDVAPAEGAGLLAHKLGCKCRKSACMKKYCECFAVNVKCTAACRCVGCKNQGNSFDQGSSMTLSMTGYHPHASSHPYAMTRAAQAPSEHWGAAQSLAFLKRGSPASESKDSTSFALGVSPVVKTLSPGGNLPSLPSSSGGTSTGKRTKKMSRKQKRASSAPRDTHKRQDDAILLAAVAMTEFGQSPSPSSGKRSAPSSNKATPPRSAKTRDKSISRRNIQFDDSPLPGERSSMKTRSSTKKVKRTAV